MKKGYSLSFCVRDIISGAVKEEEVEQIITGTKALNDEDWNKVISGYCDLYWRRDPERAEAVVRRLLNAGKIYQPRVSEFHGMGAAPDISDGILWREVVVE